MRTLLNFETETSESAWFTVNDDVMGGESRGEAKIAEGRLHFSGALSLANNGGFASVRTRGQRFDIRGFNEVVMRVRGDSRRYQLRLATDATHRGMTVSYGAPFVTTVGGWTIVRIELESLAPTARGTALDGPPIDLSGIREIGLLIGNQRAGDFLLEVDWIAVE